MIEILLDAVCGSLAAALGLLVARVVAPPSRKPRLHRVLLILFAAVGFQAGRALLAPPVRQWNARREVDRFLENERLFSVILADNPQLRDPMRTAVLKALVSGDRKQAVASGTTLLGPILPKYLAKGSDVSVIRFTRQMVTTLQSMAAHDPGRCYAYLHPKVAGPTVLRNDEGQAELMDAMRDLVESVHPNPGQPDNESADTLMQTLASHLASRYGDDLLLLQNSEAPGVDRAKVCEVTIGLYAEVLALPPSDAGRLLRSMYAQ